MRALLLLLLLLLERGGASHNACDGLCPAAESNCTLRGVLTLGLFNGSAAYCAIRAAAHLSLRDAAIRCDPNYRYSTQSPSCFISLAFARGITLHNATLRASLVNLSAADGEVYVSSDSSIDTAGLGSCYYQPAPQVFQTGGAEGTQSGSRFHAAGHGGWGGACFGQGGAEGLPYGDGTAPLAAWENRSFEVEHFGSGTQDGGAACCGGGAAIVEARAVYVHGTISARGQPPCTPSDGCSCGGNACAGLSGGAGGGGGRIALPYSAYALGPGGGGQMLIAARGGAATRDVCEAGGAGSVLFASASRGALLSLDNGGAASAARSVLSASAAPSRPLAALEVLNGARLLTPPHAAAAAIAASDSIRIATNSFVELRRGQRIHTAGSLALLSGSYLTTSGTLTLEGGLSLDVGSLVCDSRSAISGASHVAVRRGAMVHCTITTRTPLNVSVGGELTVSTQGVIKGLTLTAAAARLSLLGRMQADDSDARPHAAYPLDCAAPAPHSLRLYVGSASLLKGARLDGAAVLLCAAESVASAGVITASGMGYAAEEGDGAGCQLPHGAGSGGGHGGAGARSMASAGPSCAGGEAYDDAARPTRLGSGGGGVGCGGYGGGVIQIAAAANLSLEGGAAILADGAVPDGFAAPSGGGCGGGGGGAIVLRAARIAAAGGYEAWSGEISAGGGDGSAPGGGGGGGGVVRFEAPGGSDWEEPPSDAIEGGVRVDGGYSGACAQPAGRRRVASRRVSAPRRPGKVSGPACRPGRTNATCQPCAAGAFKNHTGASPCTPCAAGLFVAARGATQCSPCAAGFHAPAAGLSACAACAAGTFRAAPMGGAACVACAAGTVAPQRNSTRCVGCAAGRFAASAAAPCAPCAAGSFRNRSMAATHCAACANGSVAGAAGRGECTPCGAGRYAWGRVECRECEAGTYRSEAMGGGTRCVACAAGSVSVASGATNCTVCAEGSFKAAAALPCERCAAGTFRGGAMVGTDLPCLPCPPGSVSVKEGQANCTPCAAFGVGYAQPAAGQTACALCPLGQRADANGTCEACPAPRMPATRAAYDRQGSCEWHCTGTFTTLDATHDPPHCGALLDMLLYQQRDAAVPFMLGPLALGSALLLLLLLCGRLCGGRRGGAEAKALKMAPLLESIDHAMAWEEHKYRSKQHIYRLHLHGANTVTKPWRLPPIPPQLRKLMSEREYHRLAEDFSEAAAWRTWEIMSHGVFSAILPPLAVHLIRWRRQVRVHRVLRVLRPYSMDEGVELLWKSLHTRVYEGHRLELTCCAQFSLGWIDIFSNVGGRAVLPRDAPSRQRSPRSSPLTVPRAHEPAASTTCSPHSLASPREPASTPSCASDGGATPSSADLSPAASAFLRLPINVACDHTPQPAGYLPSSLFDVMAGGRGGGGEGKGAPAAAPPHAAGAPAAARGSSEREEEEEPQDELSLLLAVLTPPHRSASARPPADSLCHAVYLCGKGTFMSPYWVELNDFKTYAALQSALHVCCAEVVACLNARLMQLHHGASDWDAALRKLLLLLDAINRQLREPTGAEASGALGLAFLASHEPSKQLALLVGTGSPAAWRLPPHATLLLPHDARRAPLPPPRLRWAVEPPSRVFFGSVEPHALPNTAAALLLALLLLEIVFDVLMYGMLCSMPGQAGACSAFVLVLPFAGVVSPLVGILFLARSMPLVWRAAAGDQRALRLASSGSVTRTLHMAAAWNAASFPNALVGLLVYIVAGGKLFYFPLPWLVPFCLILSKLLIAQGLKYLSAASGMTSGVWATFTALNQKQSPNGVRPGAFTRARRLSAIESTDIFPEIE
ncbi:hypothetical protein AB1Y20_006506 [Prymnesium parvum]|uniref:Tyrosine-protein kinase ephrin type A/B receptor-like domain-containing protein n=1 Tax=Prymnesium parvum TaxID=97485 RepID=A0AB34IZU6_PRYPA